MISNWISNRRFDIKTNILRKVIKLREWSKDWNRLQVYNGFTHEERVKGWQLTWYLRDVGVLPKFPTECSICGSHDKVNYHNEDYYSPDAVVAVCQRCHFKIHKRFNEPDPFSKLVQEHAVGDKQGGWFSQLTLTPIDLAGELRTQFGEEIITDLHQGLVSRGVITAEDYELLRASL